MPLIYLTMCLSIFDVRPFSYNSILLSYTALQTFVYMSVQSPLKELLKGGHQALRMSPAFAGRGQLSPFFLLALTHGSWASGLPCCLFLVLRPGDLLLVCCSLTPSTLLSLESTRGGDRGDRERGRDEGEGGCSWQRQKPRETSGNSGEHGALRAVASLTVWDVGQRDIKGPEDRLVLDLLLRNLQFV